VNMREGVLTFLNTLRRGSLPFHQSGNEIGDESDERNERLELIIEVDFNAWCFRQGEIQ